MAQSCLIVKRVDLSVCMWMLCILYVREWVLVSSHYLSELVNLN